jgi:hypothetical protein
MFQAQKVILKHLNKRIVCAVTPKDGNALANIGYHLGEYENADTGRFEYDDTLASEF